MPELKSINLAIIGGGLAGSVLALTALQRDLSVLLLDDPVIPKASHAAAGVVNPISGRRMVLTQENLEYVEYAASFYQKAETFLHCRFWDQMQIDIMLSNIESIRQAELRSNDPLYEKWCSVQGTPPDQPKMIIKEAYRLNVCYFIECIHDLLSNSQHFIKKSIAHLEIEDALQRGLIFHNNKQYQVQNVIIADGYSQFHQYYFPHDGFLPVKGESVILECKDHTMNHILKSGHFLLCPINKDTLWGGATYTWDFQDGLPTQEGRAWLEKETASLFQRPFRIVSHQAGIRPATRDRKPLLGASKMQPNLWLFNGFGAKGTLLAPTFAQMLLDAVCHGKRIPDAFQWYRFAT